MDSENDSLDPSELGTKNYWDSVYQREKKNFKNYGDPGEIWFGEESDLRIIRWLERRNISKDDSIIDLGCGNGMMLIDLRNEGFTNLTGIDYSADAIELSKSVASSHGITNITYHEADLTKETNLLGFDIALDKGTYDAIALNPDNAVEKRKMYIKNVWRMLKENGLFIITSCNWTHDELVKQMKENFDLLEMLPTPTFQFGGKVGNIVSAVVFKKKS